MHGALFKDDGGFTTVGAAIALLLVFAVAFAGLRTYWSGSRGGEIQYVADAGALAADNAIAEFVTAGQAVDAVLLSMSLLAITAYAAGGVAAFVPGAQAVAESLVEAGSKIMRAQKSAARRAQSALDAAQRALPAVCAARAMACVRANEAPGGGRYTGFAVPVPLEGVSFEPIDAEEVENAADVMEEHLPDVAQKAQEQQDGEDEMDDAKRAAWEADCGASGMCMRERAEHLANLPAIYNPHYSSPETWSFSVALSRAKSYYATRYNNEPGAAASGTPEEVGESIARERFYLYAYRTVSKGSVTTAEGGAELPSFELLARNTEQVRGTELYTEAVYPVSRVEETRTLHAWTGCPGYTSGSPDGIASVSAIDAGAVSSCEQCKYTATTLGRVPSASTSISNGFEYYYRTVALEANRYRENAQKVVDAREELSESRTKMVRSVKQAVRSIVVQRYSPQPPGRYGCVCVVFAQGAQGPQGAFGGGAAQMGTRVAISGAALAADPASDQTGIVAEIGRNALPNNSAASGVLSKLFGAWGSALQFYSGANSAAVDALDTALGAVPFVGNDLASWAVSGFKGAMASAGLEPADLKIYKPVLVNTAHVISNGGGGLSSALLDLKRVAQGYGDAQVGDIRALASTVDLPSDLQDFLSQEGLTLLKVPLSDYGLGLDDLEIKIKMPQDVIDMASEALSGAMER